MIKAAIARTPILVLILMFMAVGYTIAHNKVVVVPLGADAGVSGYEIISNSVLINPTETSSASLGAFCSGGKKVLGGGGTTGSARHVISTSQPNGSAGWIVLATRKGGAVSGAATLTVRAICADTIN